MDVTERATFWYGCNVLRHGDIVRTCIDILRAVGIEADPVGGPNYCCGTVKISNPVAGDGMARRTVEKLNDRGNSLLIAWCPSCHSHMDDYMSNGYKTEFDMSFFVEVLHARRAVLKELFKVAIPMRVMVHRHVDFSRIAVNRMVPELLGLIPGLEVVDDDYLAPGYMCNALSSVPAAMRSMVASTAEVIESRKVDALVIVYHQCYRDLVGLETQGICEVFNYVQLLARALGIERPDDYKAWKNAGSDVASLIGEQRITLMGGRSSFEKMILPELLSLPGK